jgi:hypothetical protein
MDEFFPLEEIGLLAFDFIRLVPESAKPSDSSALCRASRLMRSKNCGSWAMILSIFFLIRWLIRSFQCSFSVTVNEAIRSPV